MLVDMLLHCSWPQGIHTKYTAKFALNINGSTWMIPDKTADLLIISVVSSSSKLLYIYLASIRLLQIIVISNHLNHNLQLGCM